MLELSMRQMMVWNDETLTFNVIWSYWNWIRYYKRFETIFQKELILMNIH